MPLSYLYVYDLFFSIPSPSGGDVSAKVRKFFIPASVSENSFFSDPLAPTSAGASGAYPSRLCECKGTIFLTSCNPPLAFAIKINALYTCIVLIYRQKKNEKKFTQSEHLV